MAWLRAHLSFLTDEVAHPVGLLLVYRRFFAPFGLAVIALPLVFGVVRPDDPEMILKEGRWLAPAPTLRISWPELSALPRQVDAYLGDRFGLRQLMISTQRELFGQAHGKQDAPQVLIGGSNGRLFLLWDEMVKQSAGLVLRKVEISQSSELISRIQRTLARKQITFLVGIPPNSSTIYSDELPIWARN